MLAGHARVCRLIKQHSKVRATVTVKDDGQGKDIVNAICNVCRDGTISLRGYSTAVIGVEGTSCQMGGFDCITLHAPAVCEGCN